jgi:hypothetical protein
MGSLNVITLLFILTLYKTNNPNEEVLPIQLLPPDWRHLGSIGGLHHRHLSIYFGGERRKDTQNIGLNQISVGPSELTDTI